MNIEKKRYIIFLYSLFLMNFVIFVIFTGENEMEILKQRILKDGVVKEGNVLKVDKFLNHQPTVARTNSASITPRTRKTPFPIGTCSFR